jgi:RHS repeat-associated protein
VDGVGTTKYTYTASGQLFTEDGPFANDTVTNLYSNRLRVKLDLQQPTGLWTNAFAWDEIKRLTNVTSTAGSFAYQYQAGFPSHLIAKLSLPNTAYITNVFDGNARVLATYLKNNGGTLLDSYEYAYNPANQRTNVTRADSSTVGYAYDKIGQLTVADSSVAGEDRGYTYDTAGNLNWLTNNGSATRFDVNALNELTNGPIAPNYYDANGNLTNRAIDIGGDGTLLSYDDENRLIDIFNQITGDETVLFYDGLGRLRIRQEFAGGGGTTPSLLDGSAFNPEIHYIYDGWRVIQERNASNVPQVSYTRGSDLSGSLEGAGGIGGLLARSHGYSSGNWSTHNYYFADGNGNVTYLVNSSQGLAAKYRYDPFGNTISSSGTLANDNVYLFSSKEFHAASGLYYYGYRFYDSSLQRWVNRDPIGQLGGLNLYEFVQNLPTGSVDPFGHLKVGDPKADINTVVCDGKGGIITQISPNTRKGDKCVKACVGEHEKQHRKDILAADPNICAGKPSGTVIAYSTPEEEKQYELAAIQKELNCLEKFRDDCPANCDGKLIRDRIKQMIHERDDYKKQK